LTLTAAVKAWLTTSERGRATVRDRLVDIAEQYERWARDEGVNAQHWLDKAKAYRAALSVLRAASKARGRRG